MITSTKNYTKQTNKQKKTDRLNTRTNDKSKAIQNHTKKHRHSLSHKKRKKHISFGKSEVFCQCSVGVL